MAVRSGAVDAPRPTYGHVGFWQGDHPQLGVWHQPDAEWEHAAPCFRVSYRSNSAGARDVERRLHSARPRVVVLGDSFLEGWGVAREERLSDRLEAATGIEHLNFAMAHFGPYQSLLVYETLARRYDHDAVLIGVLPTNDFVDLDPERARRLAGYDYRWRPYLVPEGTGWRHLDLREPRWRRWLRQHSWAFNAGLQASRALDASPRTAPGGPPRSAYWDFGERDVRVLGEVLARLVAAAADRPVAVVLIPTLADFQRLAREGTPPLPARLTPLARQLGFRFVDLLAPMARRTRSWARYYHTCDYHWSVEGNAAAAKLLPEALWQDFYAPLAATAPRS